MVTRVKEPLLKRIFGLVYPLPLNDVEQRVFDCVRAALRENALDTEFVLELRERPGEVLQQFAFFGAKIGAVGAFLIGNISLLFLLGGQRSAAMTLGKLALVPLAGSPLLLTCAGGVGVGYAHWITLDEIDQSTVAEIAGIFNSLTPEQENQLTEALDVRLDLLDE